MEELKRSGKCQANPFSRNKSKEKPKKPGRKAGQDPFSNRVPPSPEEANETKEEPFNCCPSCGGCVKDLKQHEHYEVDIPPVYDDEVDGTNNQAERQLRPGVIST